MIWMHVRSYNVMMGDVGEQRKTKYAFHSSPHRTYFQFTSFCKRDSNGVWVYITSTPLFWKPQQIKRFGLIYSWTPSYGLTFIMWTLTSVSTVLTSFDHTSVTHCAFEVNTMLPLAVIANGSSLSSILSGGGVIQNISANCYVILTI